LMLCSVRSISRARFLFGLSSEGKSYVPSGLPSSPLWQYEQRTPSARVKPIITGCNREPGQSFGNTWRFFGFSGHDHSCAGVGGTKKTVSKMMLDSFPGTLPDIMIPLSNPARGAEGCFRCALLLIVCCLANYKGRISSGLP
jgi:hypothetical protein